MDGAKTEAGLCWTSGLKVAQGKSCRMHAALGSALSSESAPPRIVVHRFRKSGRTVLESDFTRSVRSEKVERADHLERASAKTCMSILFV